MNVSNFTAFGSVGSTKRPLSSICLTFLKARWNGNRASAAIRQEVALEDVNGDAAGPIAQRAVGFASLGEFLRKVGIFNDLRNAVDRDDDADLFLGPASRRL